MKKSVQKQLEQEHEAWRRRLEFLRQENALLKYRLSEVLDGSEDKHFLQVAEYFQNELLLKDEGLKNLSGELLGFFGGFGNWIEDAQKGPELMNTQAMLRDHILQFEKGFLNLAQEFNEQMLQNS